jgi:hypothetical protein
MVWGTAVPPQPVILKPRPLQRDAGSILLVPLLPQRKTATPLPTELWTHIFINAYYGDDNVDPTPNVRRRAEQYRRDMLLICKALTVRPNDLLKCFRPVLLMVSRTLPLGLPNPAEHRPSRILLPRVDTIALATGEVHGEALCC